MKKQLSPYVSIVAWCLLPNHFHWIVYVHNEVLDEQNIQNQGRAKSRTINQSIGILLGSYTRAIQKQEETTGSLFQKRTKSKPLVDEIIIEPGYWQTAFGTQINISEGKTYLETCIQYVHQNPVYAGIVKKADEWEFSSLRDYMGIRKGKLIDYQLIKKENLLLFKNRHPSVSRETANYAIIGIGSNIDAEVNINSMLKILRQNVKVISVSSFVKTKPIGIENQPEFTNGAVKIETSLDLEEFNTMLKRIEDDLGRDRSEHKFGPRTIDLDIVVWNGKIIDEDYYKRDFLKKSVQEVI